jgi:hypothetical protein
MIGGEGNKSLDLQIMRGFILPCALLVLKVKRKKAI